LPYCFPSPGCQGYQPRSRIRRQPGRGSMGASLRDPGQAAIPFAVEGSGQVEIQLVAEGRSPFGERVTLTIMEP